MIQLNSLTRPLIVVGALMASAGIAKAAVVETSPFGATGAIAPAELAKIAGREDVAQSINAANTATVSRNTVSGNSVTGGIAFDAQAFQNMNGLSVLSANTGNNVAINSSLNVNVTLHP